MTHPKDTAQAALVEELRNPWDNNSSDTERGPLPDWCLGLLSRAAAALQSKAAILRDVHLAAKALQMSEDDDTRDRGYLIGGFLTALQAQPPAQDGDVVELLRGAVPPDARMLMQEMQEGWSKPAAQYAADTGIEEKRVRSLHRAFYALGWADFHPYHSEDDNLIRGRGYSLSPKGARIDAALAQKDHK